MGLSLGETGHLSAGLTRYTGGNPLFILETLKYLIETDSLARGLPERLAPPGRVAPLVQRRLDGLSPNALNLVRVATVAGTHFNLELAERSGETELLPGLRLSEAVLLMRMGHDAKAASQIFTERRHRQVFSILSSVGLVRGEC